LLTFNVPEVKKYLKTKQEKEGDLNHPIVIEEAAIAREAVFFLNMRLKVSKLLEYVPCPWCIEQEGNLAELVEEAVKKYRFLRYEGFHCEQHASDLHAILGLDVNMHFNCCEQVFKTEESGLSLAVHAS
jgi:hypothetical protein